MLSKNIKNFFNELRRRLDETLILEEESHLLKTPLMTEADANAIAERIKMLAPIDSNVQVFESRTNPGQYRAVIREPGKGYLMAKAIFADLLTDNYPIIDQGGNRLIFEGKLIRWQAKDHVIACFVPPVLYPSLNKAEDQENRLIRKQADQCIEKINIENIKLSSEGYHGKEGWVIEQITFAAYYELFRQHQVKFFNTLVEGSQYSFHFSREHDNSLYSTLLSPDDAKEVQALLAKFLPEQESISINNDGCLARVKVDTPIFLIQKIMKNALEHPDFKEKGTAAIWKLLPTSLSINNNIMGEGGCFFPWQEVINKISQGRVKTLVALTVQFFKNRPVLRNEIPEDYLAVELEAKLGPKT